MSDAIMWGEYHEQHITERHNVSRAEVMEVITSPRTKVRKAAEEADHAGSRYVLRGRTRAGRRLVVVVTVLLDGDLFPVTAFDPSER